MPLNKRAYHQIQELEVWINESDSMPDKVEIKSKKSRLALFTGESCTGKTIAAEILKENTKLEVFRIDLSSIVSKYIGETENNLKKIFDGAEAGGAILMFDEADALFGKRSEVKDSHDRYANQEISYLLNLIENYPGLVIISTQSIENVDKFSIKRFDTIIEFKPQSCITRKILRLKNYIKTLKISKNKGT